MSSRYISDSIKYYLVVYFLFRFDSIRFDPIQANLKRMCFLIGVIANSIQIGIVRKKTITQTITLHFHRLAVCKWLSYIQMVKNLSMGSENPLHTKRDSQGRYSKTQTTEKYYIENCVLWCVVVESHTDSYRRIRIHFNKYDLRCR